MHTFSPQYCLGFAQLSPSSGHVPKRTFGYSSGE
jgi:hypothetical protein